MKKNNGVYIIENLKDGKIKTTISKKTKETFKSVTYEIIVFDDFDSKKEFYKELFHFIELLYWDNVKTEITGDNEKTVRVIFTDKPYWER